MPAIKVNPFLNGESTPSIYSNSYGVLQILQAIGVFAVVILSSASVVMGALPIFLCFPISLADSWLLGHGVTALGCLLGMMAWRTKMAHGKLINGPKILGILLLAINFLWLLYGNVVMIFEFVGCSTSEAIISVFRCDSPYLTFFYVVVLAFDVLYLIFFVALCVFASNGRNIILLDDDVPSSDSCCILPYCLSCLYPFPRRASWQEWVAVTCVILYLLLGVASVAMGAIYLLPCGDVNFMPHWNIVNGVVTIVTLSVLLCCIGFPGWIRISWEKPSFLVFTPVIGLVVFLLIWLVTGNVVVLRDAVGGCAVDTTCDRGLHAFSIVVVILLDLGIFVLIYISIIYLFLMSVLLTITSCIDYCGDNSNDDNNIQVEPSTGGEIEVQRIG